MSNETTRPSSAADLDVFCPGCGYNVKGSSEDRCPECGGSFDRAALLEWASTLEEVGGIDLCSGRRSLWRIWLTSLFKPGQIGRSLPPWIADRSLRVYGLLMRVTVIITIGLITLGFFRTSFDRWHSGLPFVLISWPGPVLASYLCEVAIAALLADWVEPSFVPESNRYRFWHALCLCFSAHLSISSLAAATTVILFCLFERHLLWMDIGVVYGLLFTGLSLVFLWWWGGLARAIMVRSSPSPGRRASILVIPVMGAFAIVVGVCIEILIAAIMR
jgi:hypothetical protein